MFLKLLIISALILSISGIFLGIRILLKNNGRFPETHVSRNKEMRKRGISCAQDTNIGCNSSDDFGSCTTCGKNFFNHGVSQSATE
jgi:hypothetical protein